MALDPNYTYLRIRTTKWGNTKNDVIKSSKHPLDPLSPTCRPKFRERTSLFKQKKIPLTLIDQSSFIHFIVPNSCIPEIWTLPAPPRRGQEAMMATTKNIKRCSDNTQIEMTCIYHHLVMYLAMPGGAYFCGRIRTSTQENREKWCKSPEAPITPWK